MSYRKDKEYVIAQADDWFVPEFWGQIFLNLETAEKTAREYSYRTGETVYIWDLDISPYSDGKPKKEIVPFYVKPNWRFRLYVNHGMRDAIVKAVLGDECLAEYEMPNGTTALRILPNYMFNGKEFQEIGCWDRTISYRNIPKKWQKALEEAESGLIANPQKR